MNNVFSHKLNGHCNVRGTQLPDPQVLEHLQEDVGPDPQVQVLSKLLQLHQDLFGRPEALQILREFGQQIEVPVVGNLLCVPFHYGDLVPHLCYVLLEVRGDNEGVELLESSLLLALPEDFHLVLQAEAGLLGYAEKLGPHVATHPGLAIDDVTVNSALRLLLDHLDVALCACSAGPLAGFVCGLPLLPSILTLDLFRIKI